MKYLLFSILFVLLLGTKGYTQDKKGFDLSDLSIPLEKIKDGGPPRDGIPAIDSPNFIKVEEAGIDPDDRVLGVYHNGVAKAYPILIMNFHEIVNDYFGVEPIVVTYCPLCGSGIAFDANIASEPKTFGVSGLLYNSDVLLYDRQTESLWSQIMGEAISGPMKGKELNMVPTTNTTWQRWKETYPETMVLSEQTGYIRDYSQDPYPGYSQSAKLYFEVSDKDDRYHPKEMVMGLEIEGEQKAYPFSELAKTASGEIQDTFQGKEILIRFDAESQSAAAFDSEGELIPTLMNFWFAWFAFFPDTEVYEH